MNPSLLQLAREPHPILTVQCACGKIKMVQAGEGVYPVCYSCDQDMVPVGFGGEVQWPLAKEDA